MKSEASKFRRCSVLMRMMNQEEGKASLTAEAAVR